MMGCSPATAEQESGGRRLGIVEAIVLGIVQGLGEFLPISSSGHLVALPQLLGWGDHPLQFDIALHLGTLVPLLVYFWRDWVAMALALVGLGSGSTAARHQQRRMALILIAACVPAAIFGILLEEKAETVFRSPLLVAFTLSFFGLLMLIVDRNYRGKRSLDDTRMRDGMLIGAAQVLALVPGVSRSGSTITAGLMCGLSREASARFSFMLSAPIVAGAVLVGLRKMLHGLPAGESLAAGPVIAGVTAAMFVGFAVIPLLLSYLRQRDLRVFVYYRWLLAGFIVLWWATGGGRGQ